MIKNETGIAHLLILITIAASLATLGLIVFNFGKQQYLKINAQKESPIQQDVTNIPIPDVNTVNPPGGDNALNPASTPANSPAQIPPNDSTSMPDTSYQPPYTPSTIVNSPISTSYPISQSTNDSSTSKLVTLKPGSSSYNTQSLNPDNSESENQSENSYTSPTPAPSRTPTPLSALVTAKEKPVQPYFIWANPDSNHLQVTIPYATLNKGCVYTGKILLQVTDITHGGADAILRFDPSIIQIFSSNPPNQFDSQSLITSYFFQGTESKEYQMLEFNFAIKSNTQAQTGSFYFDFDPNQKDKTTDSNIINFEIQGQDFIQEVYDANFSIGSGACN